MDNIAIALIVILLAVALVVVIGGTAYARRRQKRHTEQLRRTYGMEYDHAVDQYGSVAAAEEHLEQRLRRHKRLNIHPLDARQNQYFSHAWASVQTQFVDDPVAAVTNADRLIVELMNARGYPMAEFEMRADDLSVDHGDVVQHYRAAQALATQIQSGNATTEDLRLAMIHYRRLFSDLLETAAAPHAQLREVRV